jgi:hypothetical protein
MSSSADSGSVRKVAPRFSRRIVEAVDRRLWVRA